MTKTKSAPAPEPTETGLTQLQVALNGMTSSAKVINNTIAAGIKNDETLRSVRANLLHLDYMLKSDIIKSSKTDVKEFTDAVVAAKAFLI